MVFDTLNFIFFYIIDSSANGNNEIIRLIHQLLFVNTKNDLWNRGKVAQFGAVISQLSRNLARCPWLILYPYPCPLSSWPSLTTSFALSYAFIQYTLPLFSHISHSPQMGHEKFRTIRHIALRPSYNCLMSSLIDLMNKRFVFLYLMGWNGKIKYSWISLQYSNEYEYFKIKFELNMNMDF